MIPSRNYHTRNQMNNNQNETKICNRCKRELPKDTDHFYHHPKSKDGFGGICKECKGRHFTTKLTDPKPKEGYAFCKRCGRELPHDYYHFPVDKSCKTGLRYVCRECDCRNGGFLPIGFTPQEKWTKEELELLEKVYKDYTNKELVEKFFPNRSVRSIESQANVYGWSGKNEEAYRRGREAQASSIRGISNPMSEETKRKLSESRKKYYETHENWWKGKKRSMEQCEQMSKAAKERGYWKGDKNPRHINPLNGEENGRWKGGILPTYTELRSDTKDWQDKSMEFCNYRCVITGSWFKNIHHTTPFRQIVDESFDNLCVDIRDNVSDYSTEEFGAIREELKSLHAMYGYGACLNYKVHKLFHDNYGYKDFNGYDFLDFIYRIDIGEFDDWFSENKLEININYDYVEYLENTLSQLDEVA